MSTGMSENTVVSGWAFNPLRGPAWRWDRAEALVRSGGPPLLWDDALIREAADYHRDLAAADTETKRAAVRGCWPGLDAAHALFVSGDVQRDEIEARLLAGENIASIAGKTGVDETVIHWFQIYFFNVVDCLEAMDWLLYFVVKLGTPPFTESKAWKWLALAGGVHAIDLVIADALGRTEPDHADRHEWAEKLRWLPRDMDASAGGRAFDPSVVAELTMHASDVGGRISDEHERAMLELQLNLIRLRAGLSPCSPRRRQSPAKAECSEKISTGQRNAPKEYDHEKEVPKDTQSAPGSVS